MFSLWALIVTVIVMVCIYYFFRDIANVQKKEEKAAPAPERPPSVRPAQDTKVAEEQKEEEQAPKPAPAPQRSSTRTGGNADLRQRQAEDAKEHDNDDSPLEEKELEQTVPVQNKQENERIASPKPVQRWQRTNKRKVAAKQQAEKSAPAQAPERPPSARVSSVPLVEDAKVAEDQKEEPPASKPERVPSPKPVQRIDKAAFIKSSAQKKEHYNKFPTLQDYATGKQAVNEKVSKLTTEILAEKPSGDVSSRDTLLHVLNGAAGLGGKQCFFYDSSKGINPSSAADKDSYLSAVDADDETAPKFVLKLKNLDGLIDDDDDQKHDTKQDAADKVKELKEALHGDAHHPVIEKIRERLAKAYDVSAERIVITDFYLNGFAAPHYIKDLTDTEKNNIVTEAAKLNKKMDALFPNYDSCAIHPALFHHTYDIGMFDERGNKTFGDSDNSTYKVGPQGKQRDYIQPAGWTRYGLKVLGKYGDDKWLHPFQDPGNWYRAYHGTDRIAGSSIYKGAFRVGQNNAFGKGIYCTPDVNIAASYCQSRGGIIELDTNKGKKKFYFVFQVAVNPDTMNNPALIPGFDPSCENVKYWIAPSGADIRPYGILIKEV